MEGQGRSIRGILRRKNFKEMLTDPPGDQEMESKVERNVSELSNCSTSN